MSFFYLTITLYLLPHEKEHMIITDTKSETVLKYW